MYITRSLESFFLRCSANFKAVALLGPRQVGKTTMLKRLAEQEAAVTGIERAYVTLDDLDDRTLAHNDPKLFLQTYRPPVLIDEVQKAPELFSQLKIYLDTTEAMGGVWLTGSQPLRLKQRFGDESLAGRMAVLDMMGLSQAELGLRPSVPFSCSSDYLSTRSRGVAPVAISDFYRSIWKGSLPGIRALDDDLWEKAYASYVSTFIMRDIRDMAAIEDEGKFRRFLTACAALTGQPVNYAEYARAADVSESTAKRWLSLLVSSYVVHTVPAFSSNVLKGLVKNPVLHFFDTGLVAYLTGYLSPRLLENGALSGHILETFAWGEIVKSWQAAGHEPRLSFLRTLKKKEIDLVLTEGEVSHPLEVKRTASPGGADLKNLSIMDPLGEGAGTGCVLCLADKARPLDRKNWAFPLWAI